jgi:hypothetical protein
VSVAGAGRRGVPFIFGEQIAEFLGAGGVFLLPVFVLRTEPIAVLLIAFDALGLEAIKERRQRGVSPADVLGEDLLFFGGGVSLLFFQRPEEPDGVDVSFGFGDGAAGDQVVVGADAEVSSLWR